MPSRVTRKNNAWYVVTKDPDGAERTIPCLPFGEATDERVALMKRIIDAIVTEMKTKRPEGRPPAPKPCPICEGKSQASDTSLAATVASAVALALKAMGAAPAAAPVAPPPPVAPAFVTPVRVCARYLLWLYRRLQKGRGSKQTLLLRRSNLKRLLKDLGRQDWTKWRRLDIYLNESRTDLTSTSKGKYIDAVSVLIRWALRREMNAPDVRISRRDLERDKHVDAKQCRPGRAWKLKQAQAILRAALAPETPIWLGLMVHICAYAGFAPADARNMLTGFGTFRDVDGVFWYTASRQKSTSPISVPVAATLVSLLRPYMKNDRVIRIEGIPSNPDRRRDAFVELCGRAGVESMIGQGLKRWRTFFHSVLHLKWKLDKSFRLRLMGYSGVDNANGSLDNYDDFPPEELLAAMRRYDAYLSGRDAAVAVA
jgi:hypothetical protein